MKVANVLVVLLVTACSVSDGKAPGSPLAPGKSSSRLTSGIPEPVDPVSQSASPIQVTLTRTSSAVSPTKTYSFEATASGAESGSYNYDWMMQTCDMNDYCHDWYNWQTTQSPTNTFTLTVPPGAAYALVSVYVRENGPPSYYTARSSSSFVRGPDWGQFPAGGSVGGTCYSDSYPFLEQYFDPSSSTYKTRSYSRNVCTGQKVPKP
jgi:hypothetical protein